MYKVSRRGHHRQAGNGRLPLFRTRQLDRYPHLVPQDLLALEPGCGPAGQRGRCPSGGLRQSQGGGCQGATGAVSGGHQMKRNPAVKRRPRTSYKVKLVIGALVKVEVAVLGGALSKAFFTPRNSSVARPERLRNL